jgi:hypothetical protein
MLVEQHRRNPLPDEMDARRHDDHVVQVAQGWDESRG